jgi:undecaprenyl diphosphate synthase
VAIDGSDSNGEGQAGGIPRHVAIIMDGNGRWARERNLPRHAGHKAGVKSVRSVVEESARKNIEVLTLFAFSSENWRRPEEEITLLMELFLVALRRETRRLSDNNVQLRIIGDTSAFPDKLQRSIVSAQQETADNSGLVLQIAANYGGRWDIAQAIRRIAEQVEAGTISPQEIDESTLEGELSFPDLPPPDLFIRTGGEQRLSNFLLWQAAYAELYFTPVLWPDFDATEYHSALDSFSGRQRRFGRTGEQVTPVVQEK